MSERSESIAMEGAAAASKFTPLHEVAFAGE
jgi:hypothetical protein